MPTTKGKGSLYIWVLVQRPTEQFRDQPSPFADFHGPINKQKCGLTQCHNEEEKLELRTLSALSCFCRKYPFDVAQQRGGKTHITPFLTAAVQTQMHVEVHTLVKTDLCCFTTERNEETHRKSGGHLDSHFGSGSVAPNTDCSVTR